MSRYMQTAGEANGVAKELFRLATSEDLDSMTEKEHEFLVAKSIAQLVNYGLRCAPRAVQHTVRLNAVVESVKGLPIKIGMEEYESGKGWVGHKLVYTPNDCD